MAKQWDVLQQRTCAEGLGCKGLTAGNVAESLTAEVDPFLRLGCCSRVRGCIYARSLLCAAVILSLLPSRGAVSGCELREEPCGPAGQSARAGASECFPRACCGFFPGNPHKAVPCLTQTVRVCAEGKGWSCPATRPTSQSRGDGGFLATNDFFCTGGRQPSTLLRFGIRWSHRPMK